MCAWDHSNGALSVRVGPVRGHCRKVIPVAGFPALTITIGGQIIVVISVVTRIGFLLQTTRLAETDNLHITRDGCVVVGLKCVVVIMVLYLTEQYC